MVCGWMHVNIAHVLSTFLCICIRRSHLCHRDFLLRFLVQCMYGTCGSSLLVAPSSFLDMAFPSVSG